MEREEQQNNLSRELFNAVQVQDLQEVVRLAGKANVNAVIRALLYEAVRNDHMGIVELLRTCS